MRIFLAFILGFVLAGVASAKPVDSDPVTLITAIYKTYETDQAGLPHVFSKRLQALIDKDAKETPEGEVGRIDWDDKPSDMLFDLVLEDGHWRIDDIEKTLKPRWNMSKILTDAPNAFPDAEPEKK